MGCCPVCETDVHKCTCPNTTTIKDTCGDLGPIVPTKDKPIKISGYYTWENWDGTLHEQKFEQALKIEITEDMSAEDIQKRIEERLRNA